MKFFFLVSAPSSLPQFGDIFFLAIPTLKCTALDLGSCLARAINKCANYVKPESALGGAKNRRVKPKGCKPCSSFLLTQRLTHCARLGPHVKKVVESALP